jgi:hypothetical protein
MELAAAGAASPVKTARPGGSTATARVGAARAGLRLRAVPVAALDPDAKNLAVRERMGRLVAAETAGKMASIPVLATTAAVAEAAVEATSAAVEAAAPAIRAVATAAAEAAAVRPTLNPAPRTSTIGRTGKTRAETA